VGRGARLVGGHGFDPSGAGGLGAGLSRRVTVNAPAEVATGSVSSSSQASPRTKATVRVMRWQVARQVIARPGATRPWSS
jgi:hypothetical protein